MAWVVPENISDTAGFRIVGAHTDSPAFTLKPSPQTTTADGWGQIEVEVYGGMIMNSWLDRELCVAGRLILASGEEILVRTALYNYLFARQHGGDLVFRIEDTDSARFVPSHLKDSMM